MFGKNIKDNNLDVWKVYDAIRMHRTDEVCPSLTPYSDVLRMIFDTSYLFRVLDNESSAKFVKTIISIVTKYSITDVNQLDSRFIGICFSDNVDVRLAYLKSLLIPESYQNENPVAYFDYFEKLFSYGKSLLERGFSVPTWKNLDNVCRNTYFLPEKDTKNYMIACIAAACFYANGNNYEIGVLDDFYKNIDQHVGHLNLNFGKVANMLEGFHFMSAIDKDTALNIRNYVIDSFNQVKENGCQRMIR